MVEETLQGASASQADKESDVDQANAKSDSDPEHQRSKEKKRMDSPQPIKRKRKPGRRPRPQTGYEVYVREFQRAREDENPYADDDAILEMLKSEWADLTESEKNDFEERVMPLKKPRVDPKETDAGDYDKQSSQGFPTEDDIVYQIRMLLISNDLSELSNKKIRLKLEDHFKTNLMEERGVIAKVVNALVDYCEA
ncbi:hypothetical protein HDU97_005320 [Phlyctochytrium planicorne]|nr:hypothetical protein HDU97_005320 [Phlyctochytrium planicorne]